MYTVGANELYPNGVGGIKLQVPEPEVERAREILEAFSDTSDALIEEDGWKQGEAVYRCPKCGAADIEIEKGARKLTLATVLLLGWPLFFRRNKLVCSACGHRWEES